MLFPGSVRLNAPRGVPFTSVHVEVALLCDTAEGERKS